MYNLTRDLPKRGIPLHCQWTPSVICGVSLYYSTSGPETRSLAASAAAGVPGYLEQTRRQSHYGPTPPSLPPSFQIWSGGCVTNMRNAWPHLCVPGCVSPAIGSRNLFLEVISLISRLPHPQLCGGVNCESAGNRGERWAGCRITASNLLHASLCSDVQPIDGDT